MRKSSTALALSLVVFLTGCAQVIKVPVQTVVTVKFKERPINECEVRPGQLIIRDVGAHRYLYQSSGEETRVFVSPIREGHPISRPCDPKKRIPNFQQSPSDIDISPEEFSYKMEHEPAFKASVDSYSFTTELR